MPPHAAHPGPGTTAPPPTKHSDSSAPPDRRPQLLSSLGSNHVNSTEREVKTRAGGERPSAQTPPGGGKVSAAGPFHLHNGKGTVCTHLHDFYASLPVEKNKENTGYSGRE